MLVMPLPRRQRRSPAASQSKGILAHDISAPHIGLNGTLRDGAPRGSLVQGRPQIGKLFLDGREIPDSLGDHLA
jgi:hypothetical protein